MNEERTMVLEMLAAGKITIEQANQLIEVLGEPPLSTAEQWTGQRQHEERGTPHLEPLEPIEPLGHRRRTNFTFDQMIELSEHEVDPSYLRSLRDAGLTDLTVDEIIELSEHEVDPSYFAKLREAGLHDLSVEEVIELNEHDIKPSYVKALHDAGMEDLTVDQLIELSEREVDPSYLTALQGGAN